MRIAQILIIINAAKTKKITNAYTDKQGLCGEIKLSSVGRSYLGKFWCHDDGVVPGN